MVALTGLLEAFESIKWKKVERLTVTSDSSPLVRFLTQGVSTGFYFLEEQVKPFLKNVLFEADVNEKPEWVADYLEKIKEPFEEAKLRGWS